MAAGTEPEGAVGGDVVQRRPLEGDGGAPAHIAGEPWRMVTEEGAAHGGMDAVRADDGIALEAAPVAERGNSRARSLFNAETGDAEGGAALGQIGGQDGMQIGAVDVKEGGAIDALTIAGERRAPHLASAAPVAADQRLRREADGAELVVESKADHHLHGVRCHLNAGADFTELARTLEDARCDAPSTQGRGQCQTADPAADDANAQATRHGCIRIRF